MLSPLQQASIFFSLRRRKRTRFEKQNIVPDLKSDSCNIQKTFSKDGETCKIIIPTALHFPRDAFWQAWAANRPRVTTTVWLQVDKAECCLHATPVNFILAALRNRIIIDDNVHVANAVLVSSSKNTILDAQKFFKERIFEMHLDYMVDTGHKKPIQAALSDLKKKKIRFSDSAKSLLFSYSSSTPNNLTSTLCEKELQPFTDEWYFGHLIAQLIENRQI